MKVNSMLINLTTTVSVAVLATAAAIGAQDRYTLKVPNGLAFSEFRGYDSWQTISISENGGVMAVILGNPTMIDAYKAGIPENGKPFPDGAKMAKIHWVPKKNETAPGQPLVAGTLHDVDFMVKDAKRSQTATDGDMRSSSMTPRPIRSGPAHCRTSHRRETTPNAGLRATW